MRTTLYRTPFLLVTLLAFVFAVGLKLPCAGRVSAAHHTLADYCYRLTITVTNSGGALTDYPVAFNLNSGQMADQGVIHDLLLDMRPVTTGGVTLELTAQDRTLNPARWWVTLPSIPASGSVAFNIYMGDDALSRNQGFYFDGTTDTITVTDHADLDITDEMEARVKFQTDNGDQDGWFVTKGTASTGYRFGLESTGSGNIRAEVDTQTLDVAFPTGAEYVDGGEVYARMRYIDPTLSVDFYNTVTDIWDQQSTAVHAGGITANVVDLVMGDSFTGTLRDVELRDQLNSSERKVAQWGMNAQDITELPSVDPTYTGTVTDELVGHNGAYSLSRAQSALTTSVGPVSLQYANTAITVSEALATILGTPTATDLFTTGTASQHMPLYNALEDTRTAIGAPSLPFWFLIFGLAGVALGAVVYVPTKSYELAAAVPGGSLLVGSVLGFLQAWLVLLYAFLAFAIWGIYRFGRQ